MKFLPDNRVQLPQGEKALAADNRQNKGRDVVDNTLDRWFVFRGLHTSWDNRGAVMVRQFLIRLVEHGFRLCVVHDDCF